jgi:tetratricopeptide (TPR) repeat protein
MMLLNANCTTQGKELEKTDPEHAYYKFYELYEQDPNYRDVAERCAATAFQCSKRLSGEGQKVEWLEKVIDIDPSYREGHAQQLLYGTLHDWAVKLLGESRSAAIAQLERIFPDYDKWSEVYQILVDNYYQLLRDSNYSSTKQRNLNAEAEASYRLGIEQWVEGDLQSAVAQFTRISPETKEYKSAQSALAQLCVTLGRQEHEKKQWQGAAKWWDKALAISPNEAYQALVYSYYQLLRDGDDLYAEWSNPEAVAQASYRFGIEQWGEGELQNAVEQLAKIAPEAKEYKGAQSALVQLYVTLGRQEHERKKWQSAAEWWKKARAISPNEVYQALVDSYYQLLRDGNYSSTEWSNLDAEAEARYRLGTERWSKENLEGAVEQLEGIPKETHEFPSAQFALVQIYERLAQRYDELGRQEKDRQNAFEWFEKAKKIRAKAKAAKAILRAHEIGGEPETESFHKLWGVLRQKRKMDT